MSNFIGEYGCRLDAKGRFMLPAGLRKQLPTDAKENFVVNRGFEKHLSLYPVNEWDKITSQFEKLNLYRAKDRMFYRQFHNGAMALQLDTTGRLLLPKSLMGYASIDKEVTLFAYANRIEIWSPTLYDKTMEDTDGFAALAEEVMGSIHQEGDNNVS